MISQPGAWITLICLVLAVVGWWRSGDVLRHEVLILLGILVYFGIGTISFAIIPMGFSPRYSVTTKVWLVIGAGSLAYFLGAMIGRRAVPSAPTNEQDENADAERQGRLLGLVGWSGLVVLLIASGAPLITGAGRESSSGYLTNVALFIVPALLLRLAARHGPIVRRDWIPVAMAGMLLLVTGYRTYTLLLGLSVGVLLIVDATSRGARLKIAGGALVLGMTVGVAFGYWRFTRESNQSGEALVQSVLGPGDATTIRLLAAYTFIGLFREGPALLGFLVERHPALAPHTNGAALAGMLTSPLPGEQWDARAIISKELYGDRETSLVSTIFGPWYLDFGLPGVVVALALMGYVVSRIERRALVRRDPYARAGYAYALVLMALTIHTGLSDFAFAVLIPVLFVWAATRRSMSPAPDPEPNHS